MNRTQKIVKQLGMPQGTAANKLRKRILFSYVVRCGDNFCYKCGVEIETVDELSIEHKEPWENRDASLFWDLNNIAFSHLKCNRPHKYNPKRNFSTETTSWCSHCNQTLPKEKFTPMSSRWNGLDIRCKNCRAKYKRERTSSIPS